MAVQSIYVTLFNLVGPAMPAWLLLIVLPKWRFTQWIAKTAIVPALIALVYLAGVALLVIAQGVGFMRDFGSAEGLTRLLASQRNFARTSHPDHLRDSPTLAFESRRRYRNVLRARSLVGISRTRS